ncbi:DNA replication complex GINS protein PSF1-like [Homalodisca vitripennis]|uniref:DNA replication complex GINS protein PSF1-like n=1 Tax=Homalodisca vitripennis TaxID=197043 RepID=UPI001EEA8923|nr:DNA replication complex GINS protein PSF1-like [Homalodisca vitripennis]
MIGDKAFELIKDLERSRGSLLPFDDDRVRLVFEEMRMLCEQISEAMNSTTDVDANEIFPEVKLEKAALERNQRCLLAYLWNRMQLIRQMRWEFGSILPPDIKENLSESEVKWFNSYSKSLAKYMKSLGRNHGLNLTQDIKPPKSLYVEVRSLMDYGKLELDDGEVIILKKNSQHLMPRSLSEPLIRQGILEQISN